jgi:NAD(P)-dependent dehydrogenase (short-subunit alcohol dehydrogenase family)
MEIKPLFFNKTAIVTGAGQGIGLKICEMLAGEGARVILNDVDEALCKAAAASIQNKYGTCMAMVGDSSDPVFIQTMVDTCTTHWGVVDIAIANAGITLFGEFASYPVADFDRVMEVNLRGTFYLAQAASNQMKKQEHGGSLLFTSSVTGHQAHKNLAAYGMSKAAIEMLAKNLVEELSASRINVNTIAPGATLTERTLLDPAYIETWSRITPMGRPATVEDIGHAALFLVSDKARHITGQSLIIDGGWTAVSPTPY